MKKTKIEQTCLISVLVLGLAVSAPAQPAPAPSGAPPAVDSGPGLVGSNYAELSYGYQRQDGAPNSLHDYQFVSNGSALKEGIWGLDGNFTYDYLYGQAGGFYDHRNEAQFGLTNFIAQSWGKPFVTTDAGWAWQRAGGVSRKSFAYTFTGGVDFGVLRDLTLTPFLEYQAEPNLFNHELPTAYFPDHIWYYGVKATYRIGHGWSASLAIDLDQNSGRDLGYRAGVSYHF